MADGTYNNAFEVFKSYLLKPFDPAPMGEFLFERDLSDAEVEAFEESPFELLDAYRAVRRNEPRQLGSVRNWALQQLHRENIKRNLRTALQAIERSDFAAGPKLIDVPADAPGVRLLPLREIALPWKFSGDICEVQQFLATHVRSDGQVRSFHAPVGMSNVLQLTVRDKIKLEIEFWRNELLALWRLDEDHGVTTRIDASHRRLARPAIARTIRVLEVLEFLLLDFGNQKSELGKKLEAWRSIDQLRQALDWADSESLVNQCVRDSFADGWSLSWPLLIIRAVAWSQVAWEQPYLWEAHSALKARQDHANSGNMLDAEIKLLAYLIRYQSAPGQLSRGTGDSRFLDIVQSLEVESGQADASAFRQGLITALGVLAYAHDFRNRPLNLDSVSDELQKVLAEEGYVKEQDPTVFRSFWDEHLTESKDSSSTAETARHTWSYSQFFLTDPFIELDLAQRTAVLAKFRVAAEFHVSNELKKNEGEPGELVEIAGYSFGRDHMDSVQLRHALSESICAVMDGSREFKNVFRWEYVSVPNCFDAQEQETVVVVRLRDHIMARNMVYSRFEKADVLDGIDKDECPNPAWPLCLSFVADTTKVAPYLPGESLETLDPEQRAQRFYSRVFGRGEPREAEVKDEHRAWRLFEYLFLLGIREKFIQWTPSRPAENYCPTYLIGSILDVCYRIAPNCCISFPVEIDGETVDSIRLPIIPGNTSADAPAVKVVARYVGAYAVNKLMATRVKGLRLGLQNLEKSKAGSYWRKAIRREYQANSLWQFLGSYADNYLQTTDFVQFDQNVYPVADFVLPESTVPVNDLKSLLNSHPKPEVILAGIDVGGTYTKFAFYSLTAKDDGVDLRSWNKFPESFKIETGSEDDPYGSATPFCERLLAEIDRQLKPEDLGLGDIDALGISWPGPVLNNSIREWSGVLKKFRNSKGEKFTGQLWELMQLDIAGEAARLWKRHIGLTFLPPVTLMNDGDSHAMGEIYRLMLRNGFELAQLGDTTVLLKLGTGTAGAVARNGRLIGGLMEFGKLITNLAYEPNGQYPEGLANRYCSAKTLPALACAQKPHLSQLQPALTSVEVGLLAGLAGIRDELDAIERKLAAAKNVLKSDSRIPHERDAAKSSRDELQEEKHRIHQRLYALLVECGKIAFADCLPEAIDVAELSQLFEGKWSERNESRLMVEKAVNCVGTEAFAKLRHSIHFHGIMRLEAMLQLSAAPPVTKTCVASEDKDDVERLKFFVEDGVPLSDSVIDKVTQIAKVAEQCVKRLGAFIGDLASLLHCEHNTMSKLVLGGGVLSGNTGRVAIRCAKERMDGYSRFDSLDIDEEEQTIEIDRQPGAGHASAKSSASARRDQIDPGTFGVAATGAIELLIYRRLEGLDRIRTMVESLKLTHQLVLANEDGVDVVRREHRAGAAQEAFDDGVPAELRLKDFALDLELVCGYLDKNGSNLGIIRTSRTDEAHQTVITYTRWMTQ